MNFKKLNFLLSDFRGDVESPLLERNEPCEIDAELIELIAFLPLLNLRSFSHLCTLQNLTKLRVKPEAFEF